MVLYSSQMTLYIWQMLLYSSQMILIAHKVTYRSPIVLYSSPMIIYSSQIVLYSSQMVLCSSQMVLYSSQMVLYSSQIYYNQNGGHAHFCTQINTACNVTSLQTQVEYLCNQLMTADESIVFGAISTAARCGAGGWGTALHTEGSRVRFPPCVLHWHNPSGRTMTMRSTPPLTEMCTRDITWW